jgi:hypothetical protein
MEKEKILKLLEEVLELDEETLYDKENYSIFQIVERLQEVKYDYRRLNNGRNKQTKLNRNN